MFRHAMVLTFAVAVALATAVAINSYSGSVALARSRAMARTAPAASAVVVPASPPSAAAVAKAGDGHYWAEAEVNGRWIHCLIDTGATSVALTRNDALRLGLDPQSLVYSTPVTTANGLTHAAQVELDHVSVAGARVDHVPAMVVQDGLSASLLGMSYLGRLSRFEATPTTLILRP